MQLYEYASSGGGAELFHADSRQTDMTKLTVAFRIVAKRPMNYFRSHSFTSTLSSSHRIEGDKILQ